MSIKNILKSLFAIIALLFEGFFGVVPFVLFVGQVILLAFALLLCVRIFRGKSEISWHKSVQQFIFSILATIGFFTTISLSFVGYQNYVPGVLSDVTLSGSTGQQVVFVQMSHIAAPEFYDKKKATLAKLAQNGYTILVEGVKPGTPENQALFARSLGFDMTPDLYAEVGEYIGLVHQDNHAIFASVATGSLVSLDLSIDDMMAIMGTGAISPQFASGALVDLGSELTQARETMTKQESIFIAWLGRALLNWSLRNSQDIQSLLTDPHKSVLFDTIIDRRNDRIVQYIRDHKNQNIVVMYGGLHFNGVYEQLQKLDPNWKISHIEQSEPYTR